VSAASGQDPANDVADPGERAEQSDAAQGANGSAAAGSHDETDPWATPLDVEQQEAPVPTP